MATNNIKALCIRSNAIGNKGAAEIARAISGRSSLKHLDLSDNNIKDSGIRALIESIRDNNIISFDISKNKHIRALNEVATFIENNKKIRTIRPFGHVSTWNHLNKRYVIRIINAVQESGTIVSIDDSYLASSTNSSDIKLRNKFLSAAFQNLRASKHKVEFVRVALGSGSQLILNNDDYSGFNNQVTTDAYLMYTYNYYIRLSRLFNRLGAKLHVRDLQRIYLMSQDRELRLPITDYFGRELSTAQQNECRKKRKYYEELAILDLAQIKVRCLKVSRVYGGKYIGELLALSLTFHIRAQQCTSKKTAAIAIALFVNRLLSIYGNNSSVELNQAKKCFKFCVLEKTQSKLSNLLGENLSILDILKLSFNSMTRKKFNHNELSSHTLLTAFAGGASDSDEHHKNQCNIILPKHRM